MKYSKASAAKLTVMAITGLSSALGLAFSPNTSLAAGDNQKPPVVVELFTSQGCYSCPPAEAYLGELAEQKGIVALEFHVDYWDTLVYGFHGKWKDPFSSPENTRRQQFYNKAIRNKSGVYTPQMVIDGTFEEVGSRRGKVSASIKKAAVTPKLNVSFGGNASQEVTIDGNINGSGSIYLARFIKEEVTRVVKGENHGKTLKSHNIVREYRKLADWKGGKAKVTLPADAKAGDNMGCAVLVQATDHGPIFGAGMCP